MKELHNAGVITDEHVGQNFVVARRQYLEAFDAASQKIAVKLGHVTPEVPFRPVDESSDIFDRSNAVSESTIELSFASQSTDIFDRSNELSILSINSATALALPYTMPDSLVSLFHLE